MKVKFEIEIEESVAQFAVAEATQTQTTFSEIVERALKASNQPKPFLTGKEMLKRLDEIGIGRAKSTVELPEDIKAAYWEAQARRHD